MMSVERCDYSRPAQSIPHFTKIPYFTLFNPVNMTSWLPSMYLVLDNMIHVWQTGYLVQKGPKSYDVIWPWSLLNYACLVYFTLITVNLKLQFFFGLSHFLPPSYSPCSHWLQTSGWPGCNEQSGATLWFQTVGGAWLRQSRCFIGIVVTTLEFHAVPTLLGDNKPPPTSRFPFPVKFLKLTQTAGVCCVSIRTIMKE